MHVFWSFFGFLVDFCVLYLVCMLSDIFRRNSGPVYWVNISISTSWSSDDQAPSSVSESRSRFAFARFPSPLALASSGSNSMSLSSFSPSSSSIGLDLSSSQLRIQHADWAKTENETPFRDNINWEQFRDNINWEHDRIFASCKLKVKGKTSNDRKRLVCLHSKGLFRTFGV